MKLSLVVLLCTCQIIFSASAIDIRKWGGYHIMGFYINGSFVVMNVKEIASWKYQSDNLNPGINPQNLKTWKNDEFPEYEFKWGASVIQDNRFWVLSGEGTIDNKKWQVMDTVITGTVDKDGTVANVKKVRPLPFKTKVGRALIYDNKIWFLGGMSHDELIAADILADGELGEWKKYKSYPTNVAAGGFVYYKGCFYANGSPNFNMRRSSKMYALKIKKKEVGKKWKRVDSPKDALGYLFAHNDALYYFDTLSGNIYKTTQEDDGIQLKDWQIAGKMPSPPNTYGVEVAQVPDGWFIYGGVLGNLGGKFSGFYKGAFMPFSDLK